MKKCKALEVNGTGNFLVKFGKGIYVWISSSLDEVFKRSDKDQWKHEKKQSYTSKTEIEISEELEQKINVFLLPIAESHIQKLSDVKGFNSLLALREKMPDRQAS